MMHVMMAFMMEKEIDWKYKGFFARRCYRHGKLKRRGIVIPNSTLEVEGKNLEGSVMEVLGWRELIFMRRWILVHVVGWWVVT